MGSLWYRGRVRPCAAVRLLRIPMVDAACRCVGLQGCVLIPAVFLEPRSWNQRLGSAIVDVVVASLSDLKLR